MNVSISLAALPYESNASDWGEPRAVKKREGGEKRNGDGCGKRQPGSTGAGSLERLRCRNKKCIQMHSGWGKGCAVYYRVWCLSVFLQAE